MKERKKEGKYEIYYSSLNFIDVFCNVITILLEMSLVRHNNAVNVREINFACGWWINLA